MNSRKRDKPVVAGKLVVAGIVVVVGVSVVEPTVEINIKGYSSVNVSVESILCQLRVIIRSLDRQTQSVLMCQCLCCENTEHDNLIVCRSFGSYLPTVKFKDVNNDKRTMFELDCFCRCLDRDE